LVIRTQILNPRRKAQVQQRFAFLRSKMTSLTSSKTCRVIRVQRE